MFDIILLNDDKNQKNLNIYNKIRKNIFLSELKYKSVTDVFDKKSLHFLIEINQTPIGVVRVAPELWGKIPCSKRYGVTVKGNSIEISRLAILKEHRGKINSDGLQEIFSKIMQTTREKINISNIFFSTEPAFAKLIKRVGISLHYTGHDNYENNIYRQLYEVKFDTKQHNLSSHRNLVDTKYHSAL